MFQAPNNSHSKCVYSRGQHPKDLPTSTKIYCNFPSHISEHINCRDSWYADNTYCGYGIISIQHGLQQVQEMGLYLGSTLVHKPIERL